MNPIHNLVSLEGKTCLITGATRGIGLATARLFAECGATVLLAGRQVEKLHEIRDALRANHGPARAESYVCDISTEKNVKAMFQAIFSREGHRLDVLVANAGILEDALIGMVTSEQVERVFSTNAFALIYCAQYASRLMAKTGNGGSIINISSIIGRYGNAGQTVYSGSKAAVIGITKSLAKELAPKNIRVNAIAPGFIDTDMARNLPEAKFNERLANIRLGRIGNPVEIASAALFFASGLSSYVTGQVLGVDGGMII
ncbi:SDR family NAD(P)-dependent oxidoreductase [Azonexus caeni]|uniref:SDR family NAD(P)-dependent oxidoreductase n=1 Tax=Azonexus caeni TaxID=266126 RepID=UPI003A8662B0